MACKFYNKAKIAQEVDKLQESGSLYGSLPRYKNVMVLRP